VFIANLNYLTINQEKNIMTQNDYRNWSDDEIEKKLKKIDLTPLEKENLSKELSDRYAAKLLSKVGERYEGNPQSNRTFQSAKETPTQPREKVIKEQLKTTRHVNNNNVEVNKPKPRKSKSIPIAIFLAFILVIGFGTVKLLNSRPVGSIFSEATLPPTYPPTIKNTATPLPIATENVNSQRIIPTDISLESLLKFDKEEINEKYVPSSGTYTSNEESAKIYDNPSEMLDKFREWGRVNSFTINYQFKDVCDSDSQAFYSGGSLYTSESGATQAYDFFASYDKSRTTYISQTQDNSFGENTYITWLEGEESNCSTPYTYRGVTIRFHKYNVGVTLQYYVGKGQVTDEKMLSSLIEMARIIEYKINSASVAK
jgi:hypothetical protein